MIVRALAKGLAAGAAGTTALNTTTYADMVLRGRAESAMPQKAVDLLTQRTGLPLPGTGEVRQHRESGAAALSGIATGLGAGVLAVGLGPVLRRLPLGLAAVVVGGLAMAASDVPMTRLGLTDPAQWSPADWLSDAVPHLAYGWVTAWTARTLS
jgi:hypothetical protein